MHRRKSLLARAAAMVLSVGIELTQAQIQAPLPWPPELPNALVSNTSLYVSEKSNILLDFHGSDQDSDLVVFVAGNQYRVFPELLTAFREWVRAQPRYQDLKVNPNFLRYDAARSSHRCDRSPASSCSAISGSMSNPTSSGLTFS